MPTTTPALVGGNFYGSILRKQERHDAIFTDLQHLRAWKLPVHAHELAFFALQLQGDYREQYGRQVKEFGALTIAFRPAGIPHQDEVGPRGVRFFEIEIRPSWQKALEDCSGALDTACDDCIGGELLWLGMKLFLETRGPASDDICVQSLVSELLAKVGGMPRERAKEAPSWLHRILDKLNSQYCERLTLDELGKEAGVHAVHLSRVFRKCVGEGIGEYVHRLRIQAACRRMSVPGSTLAEIAAEAGFADQSHFTRAFRRVTGMNPGTFRALMTAA
jgi:AraC family transcriptional regulator